MTYHYNPAMSHSINKLKVALLILPLVAGLAISVVPRVSAKGQAPTLRVGTVVDCSSTSISVSVDTTINDKANQYLIQQDGTTNVLIQTLPRRAVTTLTANGDAQRSWSGYRQERDGWKFEFSVPVDPVTGTCAL
jgi:hypothetical protein